MKQEKGITLIALVITIIVMLILVAVSVIIAIDGDLFYKENNTENRVNEVVSDEHNLTKDNVIINDTETKIVEQLNQEAN